MKVFKARAKVLGMHKEGYYYSGMFYFGSGATIGFKELELIRLLSEVEEKEFYKKFRVCKR